MILYAKYWNFDIRFAYRRSAGGGTGPVVKPVRGPKKDTRETARGGAGGRSSSKQGANTNAPKRSTAGSKASGAAGKVPFIYYVITCIAQNLIWLPNFSQKLFFFIKSKEFFSTLHFDEVFML